MLPGGQIAELIFILIINIKRQQSVWSGEVNAGLGLKQFDMVITFIHAIAKPG
jgi:hypothetical protein